MNKQLLGLIALCLAGALPVVLFFVPYRVCEGVTLPLGRAFRNISDRQAARKRLYARLSTGPIVVQLERGPSGHFLIPALFNDKKSFWLFDTGMNGVSIARELSNNLEKIPLKGSSYRAAGKRTLLECFALPKLVITQDYAIPDVWAIVDCPVKSQKDWPISGVLGSAIWSDLELDIDFDTNTLMFRLPSKERSKSWIDFWTTPPDLPVCGETIRIPGELDGLKVTFDLDTGYTSSLIPPIVSADLKTDLDQPIKRKSNFFPRYQQVLHTVKAMRIGDALTVPNVSFRTVKPPEQELTTREAQYRNVTLGLELLSKHFKRVYIDYANRKIAFEQNENNRVTQPDN